jgi:hypothetical protein
MILSSCEGRPYAPSVAFQGFTCAHIITIKFCTEEDVNKKAHPKGELLTVEDNGVEPMTFPMTNRDARQ